MMNFKSQNSSEDLFNSLNFAACDPLNDLADTCAARRGFKLENPDVCHTLTCIGLFGEKSTSFETQKFCLFSLTELRTNITSTDY